MTKSQGWQLIGAAWMVVAASRHDFVAVLAALAAVLAAIMAMVDYYDRS